MKRRIAIYWQHDNRDYVQFADVDPSAPFAIQCDRPELLDLLACTRLRVEIGWYGDPDLELVETVTTPEVER